jgi:regulator of sigma E protease
MLDEREGDVAPEDLPRAFNRQPPSRRIAVLFAGPAFNFLFAIVVYWIMFVVGVPAVKPWSAPSSRSLPPPWRDSGPGTGSWPWRAQAPTR